MPKKKREFVGDEEEEKFEEVWDIRKITVGVTVFIVLVFAGLIAKRMLLHQSLAPSSFVPHISMQSIKGLSDFNAPATSSHVTISLPSQQDVQNQIQAVQAQVSNLNVAQVATTSPQIQQILKQIENIPSGPEGDVKASCMRLCNNL